MQASGAQQAPLAETTSESEPNDQWKDAQAAMPLQPIRGTLDSPKDEDWFSITATTEQILRAELVDCAGFDPVLELLASNGKSLRRSVDNGGTGEGEVITNFHVEGTVFLRVRSVLERERRRGKRAINTGC